MAPGKLAVSDETAEFCAVCEYPSSRLEVADVRRIRGGPPAGAFTTTTVLQLLLHCDPSAAVAAFDVNRKTAVVGVLSVPSTSENGSIN